MALQENLPDHSMVGLEGRAEFDTAAKPSLRCVQIPHQVLDVGTILLGVRIQWIECNGSVLQPQRLGLATEIRTRATRLPRGAGSVHPGAETQEILSCLDPRTNHIITLTLSPTANRARLRMWVRADLCAY